MDVTALGGLDKLESVTKETARLAPGTLLVYSRIVQRDHILTDGTVLKKGQMVTVARATRLCLRAHANDGLSFCADEERLERHHAQLFSSVDSNVLTWGSGWVCPGRYVPDMTAKIFLVRLIDEYDIAGRSLIHEFLFFHPEIKLLLRHRNDG